MIRRRPIAAWVAGYALLLAAWVGANPPSSAPDEPAHHIKAVAAAHGQFTGTPVENLDEYAPIQRPIFATAMQTFSLPSRLMMDPRWGCNASKPDSAACLRTPMGVVPATGDQFVSHRSALGPYSPVPYVILGSATHLASSSDGALYAERVAAAAICLGLLAIAIALTTARWARLALVLAVTPTVIFTSSVVNTSGIEITAGLAHAAALLGLVDREMGKGPWAAWGVSGAVLVLARPLGLLWLVLYLALLLALAGVAPVLRRARAERRAAVPAIILLGVSAVGALAWAVLVMPRNHASLAAASEYLGPALGAFPELLQQAVGVFGWLDVGLPMEVASAVGGGWALLLIGAVALGRPRDRFVLVSAVVAVGAVMLWLQLFTQLPFGFRAQARYVMPFSVGALLLAGRTIDARLKRDGRTMPYGRLPATAIPLAVAGVHAAAWYVNARRSAVGLHGPWLFLGSSQWAPPAGWIPWLVAATCGTALLALGAATGAQGMGTATPVRQTVGDACRRQRAGTRGR